MLPDVVAFFSLVIGIVSLSLVVFIYREQYKQTSEIHKNTEKVALFVETQEQYDEVLQVEYAKQILGLFQVIRSVGNDLKNRQNNLKNLEGKWDEQSTELSSNERTFFNEQRKYLAKIIQESPFATSTNLIIRHFGKKVNDEFKKIVILSGNEDSITDNYWYEEWVELYLDRILEICEELYPILKEYVPEDYLKTYELWRKRTIKEED